MMGPCKDAIAGALVQIVRREIQEVEGYCDDALLGKCGYGPRTAPPTPYADTRQPYLEEPLRQAARIRLVQSLPLFGKPEAVDGFARLITANHYRRACSNFVLVSTNGETQAHLRLPFRPLLLGRFSRQPLSDEQIGLVQNLFVHRKLMVFCGGWHSKGTPTHLNEEVLAHPLLVVSNLGGPMAPTPNPATLKLPRPHDRTTSDTHPKAGPLNGSPFTRTSRTRWIRRIPRMPRMRVTGQWSGKASSWLWTSSGRYSKWPAHTRPDRMPS